MSSSVIPPQPSGTPSSTPSGTARPLISTTPSAGVCRIAFITRLETTRESPAGSAGDQHALLDLPAETYAAGARHRVRAGDRLADQVAERDRLQD